MLGEIGGAAGGAAKPAAAPAPEEKKEAAPAAVEATNDEDAHKLSPAVLKMVNDNGLDASKISGSGKDGRITKEDVQNHMDSASKPATSAPAPSAPAPAASLVPTDNAVREERVRMSRLRQSIAKRLKGAQDTAAILTTFNEVDMGAIMSLRKEYQDQFVKKHDVKLGFMSFFVKAAVQALKEFPAVNAEIDGDEIIYKNYYDIGIAVSTPQGLTNGGIFGSLMSTPILNAPQSAILGMHKIQQRAMVMPNGEIEARPMMYLAMSYDHRIIDGKESVSFLVRIKEALEDPQRLLLNI